MQYNRLDPKRGLADHIYELRKQIGSNDTAPTGDVGVRGTYEAIDPETGVATIFGKLPNGSTGLQQWVNDVTPPGQPATPTAEPTIGGVTITWTGTIVGGASQPEDYSRTEIEYSTNGSIWSLGGTLYGANSYTVPSLTIGTLHTFRLISYDKNGNASIPSATISATPVAMVDNPDLENALQDLRDADIEINASVEATTQTAQDAMDAALEAANLAASGGSRIWWQNDAPPAGNAYKWIGTPHASPSINTFDGVEKYRNYNPDPAPKSADNYRAAGSLAMIDEGLQVLENAAGGSLYVDPTWNLIPQVEDIWYVAVDVKVTTSMDMRLLVRSYEGATVTAQSGAGTQTPDQGWVRYHSWAHITAAPDGGYIRVLVWPSSNLPEGQGFTIRNYQFTKVSQMGQTAPYFDGDTADDRLYDLWADINDGNKPYRWDSATNTWILSTEQSIIDAINLAKTKARTLTGTSEPTGLTTENLGDLWINTSTGNLNGQVKRWDGDSWELVIESGTNAANDALIIAGLTESWKNGIEAQADRAITTFYGPDTPVNPLPGDLWLTGTPGDPMKRRTTVGWATFEDPNVAAAYERAGSALTEADKKIITYAQTTAPTGLTAVNAGDLWINTTAGNGRISRWQITSGTTYGWVQVSDNGASLVPSITAKGKVIIQSATPAVGDRLVQNLWIDTTLIGSPAAPGNIPKRWNTATSSWDAVTEKAVVDAAAVAAAANSAANTAIGDANLAYQAAGERSRIVHLNTTPPTPADGWKDGDVWYQHSTTSITSPVVDWYIRKSGVWEIQTLDETFLPLVNIGTGTYGFIQGTQLEAKSITTDKLLITSTDNLISEGDFTGNGASWGLIAGTSIAPTASRTGGPALRFVGTNNSLSVTNIQPKIPVEVGSAYRGVVSVKSNLNLITGSVRLYMRYFTSSGASNSILLTNLTNTALTANTWTTITGTGVVPIGAVNTQFFVIVYTGATSTTVDIDLVSVTRATDGKLVVDGSIDGKTITGALLQSRSETYRGIKLSGNQLIAYNATNTAAGETFRIDGTTGAVTMKGDLTSGSTITGATITGALIQTSTGVEKIRLDSTSLRAFNAVGAEYFSIVNGEVNLTGVTNTKGNTIASAGSKPIVTSVGNLQIFTPGSNLLEILPGIQWKLDEDPDTMLTYPAIVSYDGTSLSLTGGVKGGGSVWTNLEMNSFAGDVSVQASRDIVLDIMQGIGKIKFFGDTEFSGSVDQTGIAASLRFSFVPNSAYGIVSPYYYTAPMGSPGLVLLNTSAGQPGLWFSSNGGLANTEPAIYAGSDYRMYYRGKAQGAANITFLTGARIENDLEYWNPPTSTFGANVGISSSPKDRFYKLTSAPKFKVNREMIDLDTAWNILNVTPSVWYDRAQIEEKLGADVITAIDPDDPQIDPSLLDGLDLRKIPGVSAKDVEAAGLSQFVTYNAEGEVEGVSYDRMWILLVPILREILTRLNTIDKKPVTPIGPLKPIIDTKNNKKTKK